MDKAEFVLKEGATSFETWHGGERIVFTADRDTPFTTDDPELARLLDQHPGVKRAEKAPAEKSKGGNK